MKYKVGDKVWFQNRTLVDDNGVYEIVEITTLSIYPYKIKLLNVDRSLGLAEEEELSPLTKLHKALM